MNLIQELETLNDLDDLYDEYDDFRKKANDALLYGYNGEAVGLAVMAYKARSLYEQKLNDYILNLSSCNL